MVHEKNPDMLSEFGLHDSFSQEDVKQFYMEYRTINKNFKSAIREISTKLEVLDDDFQLRHQHNPIHYMETRVKSADSIIDKLSRKGLPIDSEGVKDLTDIAGIRVICHYIDDIYIIAELLKNQQDISLVKEMDYIKEPKANGYRSLHLVVSVPVFFVDRVEEIPVEVQIRTIAMDFWASLEHQLKYKSKTDIPNFIASELKECSETIASTDIKMQKIHTFLSGLDTIKK